MSDEILKRALAKRGRNEKLTREEQRAFNRAKQEQTDRTLRDGLAAFPKKLYVELSGRQHKILDEQAGRYGLPLLGKELDLGAVLRRFHDLLRDHGDLLCGQTPDGQPITEWDEELKKQRALLLRLEVAERCGDLLRKHLVEQRYQRIASLLRSACERLQHEGHAAAYEILDETLRDCERDNGEFFSDVPPLQDEIAE